ncbi:C6 finger domain-containing protein [Colletotrichum tofieldiae]|nr:C6 finger domain-containing protein [Colletotrichum tofieldiae]
MPEERIQDSDRMQSYPSPSAEAQDTGPYYHAGPRDDTQQDQPQPQPPPTSQQQPSHSASVEELQLAAQLGQDLAAEPMMHVTDPDMNVEDPNLRSIMPHPHPNNLSLNLNPSTRLLLLLRPLLLVPMCPRSPFLSPSSNTCLCLWQWTTIILLSHMPSATIRPEKAIQGLSRLRRVSEKEG